MKTIFEASCPCMKYELTKMNIKEFQIKHYIDNEFLEVYYENNNKTFLETVYSFIRIKYSNIIKKQGIDFHFNHDNVRKPHIYIHLDLNDNTNKIVKEVINDLQKEFETNWIKPRVPRLTTIIKNKVVNDNPTFQQALICYENKHDSSNTKTMMHVLSNQILWYYDNISFITNRHKYDFQ
jgi:hypothetical protein